MVERLNRDMAMVELARALGAAGYEKERAEELLDFVFKLRPNSPMPANAERIEIRIYCHRCGPLETIQLRPGWSIPVHLPFRHCRCLEDLRPLQAKNYGEVMARWDDTVFRAWGIQTSWIQGERDTP